MILIPVCVFPKLIDAEDSKILGKIPGYLQLTSRIRGMETERQLYFPWLGYFALHGENIIGTGGFKNTPNQSRRSGHVEIAYEVFEEYRGQGLGKKICNKLVDLAKDQPLCHRLIALVDLDNHKSEKVLLSNGFSLERQVEEMDGNLSNLWSLQLEKEKLATSIIH